MATAKVSSPPPCTLRPETVARAFVLWGEINRECRGCKDARTRKLLGKQRDGIISLMRRNVVGGERRGHLS